MTTGERIKTLRKAAKLSQGELAKMTGYTDRSSIAKIESNKCELTESKVKAFADAFGITVADILGMTSAQSEEETELFEIIGDVAAGYGRFAEYEFDTGKVEIPVSWLKRKPRDRFFVLRVSGDSMYPLYHDGDLVLVLKQNTADYSGQICVVNYDDNMGTLKKVEYMPEKNIMRLIPINPQYPPVVVSGERLDHCNIQGVPQMLIRDVHGNL